MDLVSASALALAPAVERAEAEAPVAELVEAQAEVPVLAEVQARVEAQVLALALAPARLQYPRTRRPESQRG